MSYCLNTTCGKPQNPSHYRYCAHCGAKLLRRSRYRAIKPIGEGGLGRRFLAFDGEKPPNPLASMVKT